MLRANETDTTIRNGVLVKVIRTVQGTVVEASCGCYGMPFRTHTNMYCPLLVRQTKEKDNE